MHLHLVKVFLASLPIDRALGAIRRPWDGGCLVGTRFDCIDIVLEKLWVFVIVKVFALMRRRRRASLVDRLILLGRRGKVRDR